MAVDEAILESVGSGFSLPTLRLYAWDPPCLSLGYAQPVGDVDLPNISLHGWEIVRRPTGGRAILHTDELTYSVSGTNQDERLCGTVLESYRRLSAALLTALHILGVSADIKDYLPDEQKPDRGGAVCFEIPSNYEITFDGRKLVGSAQARRKNMVLQHGSFPLSGDIARITEALKYDSLATRLRSAEKVRSRATTITSALGSPVSWATAADALASAFAESLNLSLVPSNLTDDEQARAETLLQEKYLNPIWTERV